MKKTKKIVNEWQSTLIANYHPSASLHQPRLLSTMIDDWEHLPTKVDASYTVVKWKQLKDYLDGKE